MGSYGRSYGEGGEEEPDIGVGYAEVDKADRSGKGWSLGQGLEGREEATGRGLGHLDIGISFSQDFPV